jgi:hypothetical protein
MIQVMNGLVSASFNDVIEVQSFIDDYLCPQSPVAKPQSISDIISNNDLLENHIEFLDSPSPKSPSQNSSSSVKVLANKEKSKVSLFAFLQKKKRSIVTNSSI